MQIGRYTPQGRTFELRRVREGLTACLSATGDVAFVSDEELGLLQSAPEQLPSERIRELKAKHLLKSIGATPGLDRLYESRLAAKRSTLTAGPALHILVPTLQCAHSCQYCQVSRALDDEGFSLSPAQVLLACDHIMDSAADTLTVEFQGGDPLTRFDLVELAIEALSHHPLRRGRAIRFVVASTLHQLSESMCRYFAQYDVKLSTSIDGPAWLHNRNRPTSTRNAFERTVDGIELARAVLGRDSVSALMTTTRLSLGHPEEIVDAYVALGLHEIFLRPLSSYGFARRNNALLGYNTDQFMAFYRRALDRVLMWNAKGTEIREVYASLILNKLISTFDAGYVDLQSPNASGQAVLVYNYDGFVYPSDEARMLAESGDTSFRMGAISTPQDVLDASPAMQRIRRDGSSERDADCVRCAFRNFCAPSPVDAASASTFKPGASTRETDHCRRQTAMFDEMLSRLARADELSAAGAPLRQWAAPLGHGDA